MEFASNSSGSNLSIDTLNRGPILINGRELGLIGMTSIFMDHGSGAVAPANGAWTIANLQAEYLNVAGVTSVTTKPFAEESNGIRINVNGVYMISLSGKLQNVKSGDLCHVAFGTGTGSNQILMEGQINVNGNWDFITHTECRVCSPGLYHYYYRCEQGSGSILSHAYVTIVYLGFRN